MLFFHLSSITLHSYFTVINSPFFQDSEIRAHPSLISSSLIISPCQASPAPTFFSSPWSPYLIFPFFFPVYPTSSVSSSAHSTSFHNFSSVLIFFQSFLEAPLFHTFSSPTFLCSLKFFFPPPSLHRLLSPYFWFSFDVLSISTFPLLLPLIFFLSFSLPSHSTCLYFFYSVILNCFPLLYHLILSS